MELLFHELGINGYTLLAQIVNFLILLFILQRFLYKPLLKFIDKRKDIIEEGLENADRAKEELSQIYKIKDEKIVESEITGLKIINDSKKIAVQKSSSILREAEKKSDDLIKETKKILDEQKKEAFLELKKEISDLAFLTAEKILKKNIDREENEKIIAEQSAKFS